MSRPREARGRDTRTMLARVQSERTRISPIVYDAALCRIWRSAYFLSTSARVSRRAAGVTPRRH